MKKSILIIYLVIAGYAYNLFAMREEGEEVVIKKKKGILDHISENKEMAIGGLGGASVGAGIGYVLEKKTETVDEETGMITSWWRREWTYGLSIGLGFFGSYLGGKVSGKKEGIIEGKEEAYHEEIAKYEKLIQETNEDNNFNDTVKKF